MIDHYVFVFTALLWWSAACTGMTRKLMRRESTARAIISSAGAMHTMISAAGARRMPLSHGGHTVLSMPSASSHACKGNGNHKFCLFRNVCLDTKTPLSQTLIYFANGPLQFQNITLNTRPPYSNAAWPPPDSDMVNTTIQAMPDAFPADAAMSKDNATVIIQTMFEFNFGHLMDSVWVAYRMQETFDIPVNARILTWSAPTPYHGKSWKGFVSKVFSMITQNKQQVGLQSLDSPQMVQNLLNTSSNQHPNARYLCFPKLVVGAGPFSFSNPAERIPSEWWKFRSFVINNFDPGKTLEEIVISKKSLLNRFGAVTSNGYPDVFNRITEAGGEASAKYNQYLHRIAQLQKSLRESFPSRSVNVVDFAKLPMKDQILMTSSLSVLITPPGGGSFIALFLPEGASLVISVEHDLGDDAVNFFENEYSLWKSFPWLSFRKVSDMLSGEVEAEVRHALANRTAKSEVRAQSDVWRH